MGSVCDSADIDRFMRSSEGKARLDDIRLAVEGKLIESISFSNEMLHVGIEFHFQDGTKFDCTLPELDVEYLRAEYDVVLQREYYVDYPSRFQDGNS